jgi:hypothetical protein
VDIRVVTEIDLKSGAYTLSFDNLSTPGGPIDYEVVGPALRRVINQFNADLEQQEQEAAANPAPQSDATPRRG